MICRIKLPRLAPDAVQVASIMVIPDTAGGSFTG